MKLGSECLVALPNRLRAFFKIVNLQTLQTCVPSSSIWTNGNLYVPGEGGSFFWRQGRRRVWVRGSRGSSRSQWRPPPSLPSRCCQGSVQYHGLAPHSVPNAVLRAKIVSSSCTHLRPAQVMEVIMIDIQDYSYAHLWVWVITSNNGTYKCKSG